jgi:hypothetical protein
MADCHSQIERCFSRLALAGRQHGHGIVGVVGYSTVAVTRIVPAVLVDPYHQCTAVVVCLSKLEMEWCQSGSQGNENQEGVELKNGKGAKKMQNLSS